MRASISFGMTKPLATPMGVSLRTIIEAAFHRAVISIAARKCGRKLEYQRKQERCPNLKAVLSA
jgi:hypothetical protein